MGKMKISILLCLLLTSSLASAQQPKANGKTRIPAQSTTSENTTPTTPATTTATEGSTTFEDTAETPAEDATAINPDAETDSNQVGVTTARPRGMRLPVQSVSSWAAGVTTLQWNEILTVSQLGTTTKSNMNFNGVGLILQKETYYLQWGWNVGGMLAAGRANSGPFANDVKIERQGFTMMALTPRIFWRLTNSVNIGGTAMIYIRNIDLPTGNGVEMTAGRKNNAGFLADMNLRIFKTWDFYQAIGPINDGAYLWKVGVNYRF
ncbi:hypothetical protein DOM22_13460 [Bdellovibrio sp. ZAP7]|uniref:hypothetical protein n=1 Tax=Bdellovibrio sp. ZAP7 TaxID=2231053 RepID=UPI00115753EA|nr:hypothetical protein [Bdellovibrio sp. ZAP7]QDK46094.1 hypothetical protein DOM22_13460 [Bdellovibrio sp. ZAP7]